MKKIIAILGVVALSATVFLNVQSFSTDSDVASMNLSSLLELNSANAEDISGPPPDGMKRCRTTRDEQFPPFFKRVCSSCTTMFSKHRTRGNC